MRERKLRELRYDNETAVALEIETSDFASQVNLIVSDSQGFALVFEFGDAEDLEWLINTATDIYNEQQAHLETENG